MPHLAIVAAAHGDVWPAEGHEGGQCRKAAGINQVALVVQHVQVDTQVPHLAACRGEGRRRIRAEGDGAGSWVGVDELCLTRAKLVHHYVSASSSCRPDHHPPAASGS